MHPLVRIPCILVAAVGLHVSINPPNPPASAEERAPSTKLETFLAFRSGPPKLQVICWGLASIEVAVALAKYAPSLPVSQAILSNLIFTSGGAERIRLTPLFFFGSFLTTMGGWIRYYCYKAMGKHFTFEMTIGKDHSLITSGPYGLVRHPSYTGLLAAFFGLIPLFGAEGSWLRESGVMEGNFMKGFIGLTIAVHSITVVGLLQRMFKEDEVLHQKYGKQWEEWARRVPSRLVPWLL